MSIWVDFLVYALQVLLFWAFLPRQGHQFTLPMIADRDPEWLAAHRDVAARLDGSRWFLDACRVWGAVSIVALLAVALDLTTGPLGGAAAKWEVLKDLNSVLLMIGSLVWCVFAVIWFRWLRTYVPLANTRRATLTPRVVSDYLSRPWRVAIETLTVLHLCAWVVIGVLGWAGGADYWSAFAFVTAMSVLFKVAAALAPRRRPGYPDRLFGDNYRRAEQRVWCLFRLTPVIAGCMMIGEQAFGFDPDRVGHLLLVSVVNLAMLTLLGLRPVAPSAPSFSVRSRLSA